LIAERVTENSAGINRMQMSPLFIPIHYSSKTGIVYADSGDNLSEAENPRDREMKPKGTAGIDQLGSPSSNDGANEVMAKKIESLTAQIEELRRRIEKHEKE
jgi:hypothetical protein